MSGGKPKVKDKEYSLTKAVEAVKDKSLSLRAASAMYDIPRSTIHNYIMGKSNVGATKGPNTILTSDEEQQLVEWALHMAQIGYGQTRRQICEMVKRIMDQTKRPNPFTNNRPGKDWWYAFLRRHPKLAMRQPQPLEAARAVSCTPAVLDRWFAEFEQFLLQYDLYDKPHRIWNCDESGFPLCPKTGKVLTTQGIRNVYHVTGNGKEQVTTLCAVSAAGGVIPPMHVFPGERFTYNPLEGGIDGAYCGKSSNGWMTQELFFGWISGHFAIKISPERPVCLLVDGHSSHIDLDVSNFCQANGILLYCLPPHTTHVLQPLDVGFFSPLKRSWHVAVTEYQQSEGKPVNKWSFAKVFKTAYHSVVKLSTIVNAFKACGIYPVNRHAINPKKLMPAEVYHQKTECSSSDEACSSSYKPSVGASKLALLALEEELDQSTMDCFKRRYKEGYDVTDDVLYNTWRKLKKASQPLANITNTKDAHLSTSTSQTQSSNSVQQPPSSAATSQLAAAGVPNPSFPSTLANIITNTKESDVHTSASSSQAQSTAVQQTSGVSIQVPSSSVTVSQPTSSASSTVTTCNHALKPTNEIIEQVLAVPVPQTKKPTKRAQGTAHMPKHLSGEQMVQILEERKMIKIREAEEKEERRVQREVRKRKREEEKQKRQEEKQAAAEARKRRREEKEKEKEYRQAEREARKQMREKEKQQKSANKKRLTVKNCKHKQQSSESSTTVTICPICLGMYTDADSSVWVECECCNKWLHLNCTTIPLRLHKRLDTLKFVCQLCQNQE